MRTPVDKTWTWVPIALGIAAAIAVLFCFDPERTWFYPKCFFHTLTGLKCPGCGSLRALHALLHGHFARAIALNPLLFVCGLIGAVLVLRAKLNPNAPNPLEKPIVFWSAPILIVLFWIVRNLSIFSDAAEKWQ